MTIAMKRGNDLRYLHSDHLGSNTLVTNANGTVHSSQNYCAYGGQRIATMFGEQCDPTAVNPLPTDRTYTGQEQDGTGLMYFRARFVDPSLGTFLSPDTIVPDVGVVFDYNRFMYVRGNALKYNDPTGHCPWCIVGAVVGGVVGGGFELGRQMLNEHKDWADVDWRRVGVSSVGGAVAGGTMGLASTASIGAIALWGAGSSVLGGQAAAVTDGAFEYFESGSAQQALNQAVSSGFLDPETIMWDAGTGAVSGVVSAGFSRVLQSQFSMLQGSPGEIIIQDRAPLYMMRFEQGLGSKGAWVFRDEGRKLVVQASGLERLVRSGAQGAAETAEEVLQNLVEEGIAWWQDDD